MAKYIDRIVEEIIRIAEPILAENALELVEVQYRQENIGWVLRFIIHKEGGISVADCTLVSREVGRVLDVEDLIPQKYILEVSSPGLDRPLRTVKDFLRNIGKKIKMSVEIDGISVMAEGIIEEVAENFVVLRHEDSVRTYATDDINNAQLVIEF